MLRRPPSATRHDPPCPYATPFRPLNRPDRHNARDNAMSAACGEAISAAQDDPAVRAILLRGEGKSFCTGRDTAALGVRAPGVSDFAHVSKSQKRKFQILDSQKPFVAAIRGYAIDRKSTRLNSSH